MSFKSLVTDIASLTKSWAVGQNPAISSVYENITELRKNTDYPTTALGKFKASISGTSGNVKNTITNSGKMQEFRTGFNVFYGRLKQGRLIAEEANPFGDEDFNFDDMEVSFSDDFDEGDDAEVSISSSVESSIALEAERGFQRENAAAIVKSTTASATQVSAEVRMSTMISDKRLSEISSRLTTMQDMYQKSFEVTMSVMKSEAEINAKMHEQNTVFQNSVLEGLKSVVAGITSLADMNVVRLKLLGLKPDGTFQGYAGDVKRALYEGGKLQTDVLLARITSAIKSSGGGLLDLPIGEIFNGLPNMLVDFVMSPKIKKAMSSLNKTLESLPTLAMLKLNDIIDHAKPNSAFGKIGKFIQEKLDLKDLGKSKTAVKSSKVIDYRKEGMSWNGVAQKSLVEVIPTYLKMIYSAVSGTSLKDSPVFDYSTGKFTTTSRAIAALNEHQKKSRALSELENPTMVKLRDEILTRFNFKDEKQREKYAGDIEQALAGIAGQGKLFNGNLKGSDLSDGLEKTLNETFKQMSISMKTAFQQEMLNYGERISKSGDLLQNDIGGAAARMATYELDMNPAVIGTEAAKLRDKLAKLEAAGKTDSAEYRKTQLALSRQTRKDKAKSADAARGVRDISDFDYLDVGGGGKKGSSRKKTTSRAAGAEWDDAASNSKTDFDDESVLNERASENDSANRFSRANIRRASWKNPAAPIVDIISGLFNETNSRIGRGLFDTYKTDNAGGENSIKQIDELLGETLNLEGEDGLSVDTDLLKDRVSQIKDIITEQAVSKVEEFLVENEDDPEWKNKTRRKTRGFLALAKGKIVEAKDYLGDKKDQVKNYAAEKFDTYLAKPDGLLWKKVDVFKGFIHTSVMTPIKEALEPLIAGIKSVYEKAKNWIIGKFLAVKNYILTGKPAEKAGKYLKDKVDAVRKWFSDTLWSPTKAAVKPIVDYTKAFTTGLWSSFSDKISEFAGSLFGRKTADTVKGRVNEFVKTVTGLPVKGLIEEYISSPIKEIFKPVSEFFSGIKKAGIAKLQQIGGSFKTKLRSKGLIGQNGKLDTTVMMSDDFLIRGIARKLGDPKLKEYIPIGLDTEELRHLYKSPREDIITELGLENVVKPDTKPGSPASSKSSGGKKRKTPGTTPSPIPTEVAATQQQTAPAPVVIVNTQQDSVDDEAIVDGLTAAGATEPGVLGAIRAQLAAMRTSAANRLKPQQTPANTGVSSAVSETISNQTATEASQNGGAQQLSGMSSSEFTSAAERRDDLLREILARVIEVNESVISLGSALGGEKGAGGTGAGQKKGLFGKLRGITSGLFGVGKRAGSGLFSMITKPLTMLVKAGSNMLQFGKFLGSRVAVLFDAMFKHVLPFMLNKVAGPMLDFGVFLAKKSWAMLSGVTMGLLRGGGKLLRGGKFILGKAGGFVGSLASSVLGALFTKKEGGSVIGNFIKASIGTVTSLGSSFIKTAANWGIAKPFKLFFGKSGLFSKVTSTVIGAASWLKGKFPVISAALGKFIPSFLKPRKKEVLDVNIVGSIAIPTYAGSDRPHVGGGKTKSQPMSGSSEITRGASFRDKWEQKVGYKFASGPIQRMGKAMQHFKGFGSLKGKIASGVSSIIPKLIGFLPVIGTALAAAGPTILSALGGGAIAGIVSKLLPDSVKTGIGSFLGEKASNAEVAEAWAADDNKFKEAWKPRISLEAWKLLGGDEKFELTGLTKSLREGTLVKEGDKIVTSAEAIKIKNKTTSIDKLGFSEETEISKQFWAAQKAHREKTMAAEGKTPANASSDLIDSAVANNLNPDVVPKEFFKPVQSKGVEGVEGGGVMLGGGADVTAKIMNWITEKEGYSPSAYYDHLGKLTIGIGHLVTPAERNKYGIGTTLSEQEVFDLFISDFNKHYKIAKRLVPNLDKMDTVRQAAYIGMVYQMGLDRKDYVPFNNMYNNMQFKAAADRISGKDGKKPWVWYSKQTPARAKAVEEMIRTGNASSLADTKRVGVYRNGKHVGSRDALFTAQNIQGKTAFKPSGGSGAVSSGPVSDPSAGEKFTSTPKAAAAKPTIIEKPKPVVSASPSTETPIVNTPAPVAPQKRAPTLADRSAYPTVEQSRPEVVTPPAPVAAPVVERPSNADANSTVSSAKVEKNTDTMVSSLATIAQVLQSIESMLKGQFGKSSDAKQSVGPRRNSTEKSYGVEGFIGNTLGELGLAIARSRG